jgi:hypothetical protein
MAPIFHSETEASFFAPFTSICLTPFIYYSNDRLHEAKKWTPTHSTRTPSTQVLCPNPVYQHTKLISKYPPPTLEGVMQKKSSESKRKAEDGHGRNLRGHGEVREGGQSRNNGDDRRW